MRSRGALNVPLAVLTAVVCLWLALPAAIEWRLNTVAPSPAPSARGKALFATLRTADLHADSLLWGRDLLRRSPLGQVDVPRLLEGHAAAQVFGLVTQVPYPLRARNPAGPDVIRWLAVSQMWPPRTWGSPLQRALYQARRLEEAARRSGGRLTLVRSSAELRAALGRRAAGEPVVAGLLAAEGSHCLEGDLANLDALEKAGVRMLAPTHFFDSGFGGSAHGMTAGGLTSLGKRWLAELERRKLIVDLAHASPDTVGDVLKLARRPVVVSHTGVRATCDNKRNLSDEQLKAIAAKGGLVGIGYWSMAVCGAGAPDVARAVAHAVRLIGAERVALGSDFDGAVQTPFDASRLDVLASALLDAGLSEAQVRLVMGESLLGFLERNLP